MGMNGKSRMLASQAKEILSEYKTAMTLRQIYYQLVARGIIENSSEKYGKLSRVLKLGRKDGTIGWDQIEDRLRRPRSVSMWQGLG